MAKVLMVQGTMSNAGKSLLVCGLCRIFRQDGWKVAPFKSQNMALNSFVTKEGLEMGRAQVMQAEAAGCEPEVAMNPILLKPTDNEGSQVIVNGRPIGNMKARDYFRFKKSLVPDILKAYDHLAEKNDIIVIEGAGSPAEINLKENDIVNMGMAKMVDAPVLLVGDIDRGGVFAQLLGTMMLLEEDEAARVKGLVINKFRGDASLLDSGISMLEGRAGVPVVGVVPYMDLHLEDEDSLSEKFYNKERGKIDIAVIRFPRISNFTDFDVFEQFEDVSVRYITGVYELGSPDMIVLPGSKSTVSDLEWMKETHLAEAVSAFAAKGRPVFGICGGYQMLGISVSDPDGVEGTTDRGEVPGLGLLPTKTVLTGSKLTRQYTGQFVNADGIFRSLADKPVEGYEIHMGQTEPAFAEDNAQAEEPMAEFTSGGTGSCRGNVYGTYVHGVFDKKETAAEIIRVLAENAGVQIDLEKITDQKQFKESQYDLLADTMRQYLDMDAIYGMLQLEKR